MKTKTLRNSLLLVLTALIWGIAFVAQSEGGDAIGAFAFNGIRSLIGSLVLVPVIFVLDRVKPSANRPTTGTQKKMLWKAGVLCGMALFVASNFQQVGLTLGTPAGKAGFLTACYILIVPIIGIFFKKKCGLNVWCGVILTLIGLYFLCMKTGEGFTFALSDLLVILCAFMFSIQIMLVDHYAPLVDGVRLSSIQFLITGILSCSVSCFYEPMGNSLLHIGLDGWLYQFANPVAWVTLLYAGVLSCGVAYTLQIIGQNGLNPTVASLLMSLESVFSVLAGWVLLHETLGSREITGCALIFTAIILAQLPSKKK